MLTVSRVLSPHPAGTLLDGLGKRHGRPLSTLGGLGHRQRRHLRAAARLESLPSRPERMALSQVMLGTIPSIDLPTAAQEFPGQRRLLAQALALLIEQERARARS